MEDALKDYLKDFHGWDEVYIESLHYEGTSCVVAYSSDEEGYFSETARVNIWEMLEFVNKR